MHFGSFGKRLMRAAIRTFGVGPIPSLALQLLGFLSRNGVLPIGLARRIVGAATRAIGSRRLTVGVKLPNGASCPLIVDTGNEILTDLFLGAPDPVRSPTVQLFMALCREAEQFIDVGANAGLYSLIAATEAPTIQILSFEPTPKLAELIRANAALNHWQDRLRVSEEVLGPRQGICSFYLSTIDLESTIVADRIPTDQISDVVQRTMTSLDTVFDTEKIDQTRTVVKIDVEGAEGDVIAGFVRTLQNGRGIDLILELLGESIGAGLIDQIIGYGLNVYYIDPGGFHALTSTQDLTGRHKLGFHDFYVTHRNEAAVKEIVKSLRSG